MTSPDIFDFNEYSAWLRAWKQERQLSHRQIANMTGQPDSGLVANLIEKRRPFSRELQAAFAPVIPLTPEGVRYLGALVEREEALSYEQHCVVALRKAEARAASHPGPMTRNAARVARIALEMARDELRRAEAMVKLLRSLHEAAPSRAAALTVASTLVCAVIEELARCPGFRWDSAWIQERFLGGPSKEVIEDALNALAASGVLERGVGSEVLVRGGPLVTEDEVPRALVRRLYEDVYAELGRGLRDLFESPNAWRASQLGAVTLALPASAVPRVQALVASFREHIVQLAIDLDEPAVEVYQVLIGFFPLTGTPTCPAERSTS